MEVYPEIKWNMVWLVSSLEMGGSTPRASHVRRIMFVGWLSDVHGILAL